MRLDGRLGVLLAAIAGLALPLSFAPFDAFPVAPLSVAVLFLIFVQVPARRAFLCGWIYGLAAYGFGVFWIHESFQFNNIALGWALFLTGLLVMFLALYPAVVGYGVRRLAIIDQRVNEPVQLLLLLPAAWVLAEWVRGWFFTGFTWLQLGYSQIGWPLQGLAPVGGIYLVGWAVATSAGLLVLVVRDRRDKPWLWIATLVVIWVATALLGMVRWTAPAGDTIKVALVQGNLSQDRKWLPEMRRPTLERYLRLTRAHWDADLIVWPESALPGVRASFDGYVDRLSREAQANDSHVVFGVPVLDRETQQFYNSVFVVGEREMVYHKRHLVPFGEYLPLDALIRPVTEALGLPVADFTPGPDGQEPLEAGGHRLGVSVCYEIAFGNEILQALPEAAVLVTISNDAWFGTSIGPHQHMQIARARALETGRYLLRSTNTGITAIVGPDGAVEAQAPQFEVQVLEGEIFPMQGMTPYARTGDVAVIALVTLVLAGTVVSSRRRSARDDDG